MATKNQPERFVALFDLHYGYERVGRAKRPLHDSRALSIAEQFIKDFKPHHLILGGDMLDCGVVSHHNHGKPGLTEGLRLQQDAEGLAEIIARLDKACGKGRRVYHIGNHEDWLADLDALIPGIEGMLDVDRILGLDARWEVIPVGLTSQLGKLVFAHGDQIKGGQHSAKWAVDAFNRNVRFGHHHTFQSFTRTTALDAVGNTGIAVPCLCYKNPRYGGGAPNRWMQGFLWGYVDPRSGKFNDYITIIIDGEAIVNGKVYRG